MCDGLVVHTFVFLQDEDCSHIVLELFLSYSNWCLMSGGLEEALKVLNVSVHVHILIIMYVSEKCMCHYSVSFLKRYLRTLY